MKPNSLFLTYLAKFLWPADNSPKVIGFQLSMSKPLVRLAALQPSAELCPRGLEAQRAEVLSNAFALLKLAAEQKADLVLFSERFPMRGVRANGKRVWEWAQKEGDELFNRVAETARQHQMAIVAPVDERHGGRLYNAAWVLKKQGEFLGRYCKLVLRIRSGLTRSRDSSIHKTCQITTRLLTDQEGLQWMTKLSLLPC